MAKYDWEVIRAEFEAGSTMGQLSKKYGADKAAISRRAKKESWAQDTSAAINRMAEAKVNGIVNTVDPEKKAAAMQAAADAKASVIQRHKIEWEAHQRLVDDAIADDDFERAKLAKITAETIKIRQEGERKAWGLDKDTTQIDAKLEIVWHE
ncbi:MAG: hypothetical protein IJT59_07085 [Desulfovibrionaceae bacterium]|nr:hypothetical protein [Desulfovibrionaceae bacterium]